MFATNEQKFRTKSERLQKSPEELQAACESLNQRREWSSQTVAGDAAETEYTKLQQQSADAEKALADLIEKHNAKHEPLGWKIEAARNAISVAADARRRLTETTGDESKRTAFDDIDSELAKVQSEHQTVLKALRDRQTWVKEVQSRGNSAASEDLRRLSSARDGLKTMQQQDSEFRARLQALQDQRNAAAGSLLRPEAI